MKKHKAARIITLLLAFIFALAGCGSINHTFDPKDNSLYIKNDGTIIEALFDSMDQEHYSEDGLKAFIEEAVIAYNTKTGNEAKAYNSDEKDAQKLPVAVNEYKVKDGKAELKLEYSSSKHYIAFNGEEGLAKQLSMGTVESATAVGINLDLGFKDIKNGENVSVDTIKSHGDYYVVLIEGNTTISVDGTIMYVTSNVTPTQDNEATVAAQGEIAYIIFK